jgi:pimeloyl-ACP methyl ester carboxylesterase
MDRLLADAIHVRDSLGMRRPVVAGHSWGATVALELVGRHPTFASGLVFVDGPVQSASHLFSWEEGQKFMQPPLPRYSSFAQAIDDAKRDFDSAWADDLEPFVMARVMQEGTSLILTLTAPARLELLRGLYDSPVDLLWAQLQVPAVALLARGGPGRMTGWRESGAKRLTEVAPAVAMQWFDTPHDIPLFAPEAVAAAIEKLAASSSAATPSEAAAGKELQH